MFNAFVWQLCREAERGRRVLERCLNFSGALREGTYSSLFFGPSFDEAPDGYPETDPDSANLISAVEAFSAERPVTNLALATVLF